MKVHKTYVLGYLVMKYRIVPLYSACARIGATKFPSAATVTVPSETPNAVRGTRSPADKCAPAKIRAWINT